MRTLVIEDDSPLQRLLERDRVEESFAVDVAAGGAGSDLAISQRVAAAHGGVIDVRSEPGRGSCFTVRLPAAAGLGSSREE